MMNVKRYMLNAWELLEPLGHALRRLSYIDQASPNIFRVKVHCYKGKNLMLSDGISIQKNDLLVKIHLKNLQLLNELLPLNNDLKKYRIIQRYVEQSLPGVYQYIEAHKQVAKIKGIFGITMLHRGCQQLYFDVIDIPSPSYRTFKWISFMPIHFLSVSKPLKSIRKHKPKYLVMSTHTLAKKYGGS